ncbi:MAG TPA: nucleotide pyrophosphatase/phosphodiesterase family protein [Tepidisphaeraceae bacterium]|jgi:predicted AlkP superfamily pyrophosphatase or phosphodiesterase|nr:nucleotide pyrophosphatase/phosphodiesterase family protein [Tepidisphaeraceae bacterium]
MSSRVCVIDMPGLSRELLGEIPPGCAVGRWLAGQRVLGLTPSFPAVTCSVQATLTTGVEPEKHGMIANGLPTFRSADDRALVDASNFAEFRRQISFWEQSNQFLEVPRFWQDSSGKSRWKTALLFFQNSMPGFAGAARPAADIVLTPKPDHGPDGKLVNLCWSQPAELVPRLFKELGPFPLMNYWGPMAGIASSQWIARAAAIVWREQTPQLQWVYVPHLDYDMQRFGPNSPQAKAAVRDAAMAIEPLVAEVLASRGKIVLLSEYAMRPVDSFLQPNSVLEQEGLLFTRQTPDGRLVDFDRSAFVMVDHQIAHVYAQTAEEIDSLARVLDLEGVQAVLREPAAGIRHRRAGDLILLAEPGTWFDYRWWSRPEDAPAFAKTIDIHRKPGYDALELFWDRSTNGVSQNPALVRGSHGIVTPGEAVIVGDLGGAQEKVVAASDVARIVSADLTA